MPCPGCGHYHGVWAGGAAEITPWNKLLAAESTTLQLGVTKPQQPHYLWGQTLSDLVSLPW